MKKNSYYTFIVPEKGTDDSDGKKNSNRAHIGTSEVYLFSKQQGYSSLNVNLSLFPRKVYFVLVHSISILYNDNLMILASGEKNFFLSIKRKREIFSFLSTNYYILEENDFFHFLFLYYLIVVPIDNR